MKEFLRYTLPRKDYGPAFAKFYEIEFSDLLTKLDAGEFTGDDVLHAIVAVGKRCPSKLVGRAKARLPSIWTTATITFAGRQCFVWDSAGLLMNMPEKWRVSSQKTQVRTFAVLQHIAWEFFFKASKDANTLGHLARVVQNEEECSSVRSAAYGAILMILDPTQEREIARHITSAKLRPDVNWELVRHLSR